jgi:hypothetical protein
MRPIASLLACSLGIVLIACAALSSGQTRDDTAPCPDPPDPRPTLDALIKVSMRLPGQLHVNDLQSTAEVQIENSSGALLCINHSGRLVEVTFSRPDGSLAWATSALGGEFYLATQWFEKGEKLTYAAVWRYPDAQYEQFGPTPVVPGDYVATAIVRAALGNPGMKNQEQLVLSNSERLTVVN